jgi:branched-chain amino acid transport system ATP-binding protein
VSYGQVEAVHGIDLEVGAGEAVSMLGANGAGKSSTLRALSRLIRSGGQIVFDGVDRRRASADGLARAGLVHVPEGRRLFASLTTEENLLVGRSARAGRPPLFDLDDIYDLFPPLAGLRRRSAWALSGGEQQMAAIGRALLAAPRLLLLDEPSLGLAPVMVDAVYTVLARIRSQVSIFVVEQNASLALDLCDRAYVLATGRIVMSGPASDFADRAELLASYLARDEPSGDEVEGDAVPDVDPDQRRAAAATG